jgi:hypothetical protein
MFTSEEERKFTNEVSELEGHRLSSTQTNSTTEHAPGGMNTWLAENRTCEEALSKKTTTPFHSIGQEEPSPLPSVTIPSHQSQWLQKSIPQLACRLDLVEASVQS